MKFVPSQSIFKDTFGNLWYNTDFDMYIISYQFGIDLAILHRSDDLITMQLVIDLVYIKRLLSFWGHNFRKQFSKNGSQPITVNNIFLDRISVWESYWVNSVSKLPAEISVDVQKDTDELVCSYPFVV